ncbi:hypothetical protein [Vaginisenegalia massiliensis]|uniref:hypothetical protein n=1 Tax=Vaginisenegalia massiliensis TaxID=2058294 RepID=UPI000F5484BA|nr:hypothetical protein [Vaginisenegalia massiliensis]
MAYIFYFILGALLVIFGGLSHHLELILLGLIVSMVGMNTYLRKKHPENYRPENRPKPLVRKRDKKATKETVSTTNIEEPVSSEDTHPVVKTED